MFLNSGARGPVKRNGDEESGTHDINDLVRTMYS